jgi:hypothetical protein
LNGPRRAVVRVNEMNDRVRWDAGHGNALDDYL